MSEYKGNSHKSKVEEVIERKPVEKVATGVVKKKKKTSGNKLAEAFLAEDITNVKSYILDEVLLPAIKKAVSDIVTNGIDMMLYGETGRSTKKEKGSRVSYSSYYESDRMRNRDVGRSRRTLRSGYDYEDVILESRGEAEDVLDRMDDLLDTYGMVSVADLYELVGIDGRHTDNKYGWTNLRNADIVRTREGYWLKFPKALPLN